MALALGFTALLILDPDTQLLALTLGGALAVFGLALAIAGARLVPQVTAVEPRPIYDRDTSASDEVAQRLRDGVEGITRRRMLTATGAAALAGLAAAVAAPLIALGPGLTSALANTPWRRGRRLVDADGAPVPASALEVGGFLTAFPEGANPELVTSSLILVRVDAIAAAATALARRLGTQRDRRLLEDLHSRRLCGLAVSLAAEPDHGVRWPGARLPVPLLDVRRARRRRRRIRPCRAAAAPTAARDRP